MIPFLAGWVEKKLYKKGAYRVGGFFGMNCIYGLSGKKLAK
jgi:uncharacterized membrane protein YeaQ/YmgE (transglycosylase-associated protein family)